MKFWTALTKLIFLDKSVSGSTLDMGKPHFSTPIFKSVIIRHLNFDFFHASMIRISADVKKSESDFYRNKNLKNVKIRIRKNNRTGLK